MPNRVLICLPIFLLLATLLRAQDSVKLSGKIEYPLSETIKVTFNDNNLAYYPKSYTATVDKKGQFKMVFPFPKHVLLQVEVNHGDKLAELLLSAGDSLFMKVNTRYFDSTVHYYGRSSDIQNFIALHTISMGRMNQYTIKVKTAINEEPDTFLKRISSEYKNELNFLEKYGTGLPKAFVNYWKTYYRYYNYFFMQQYPQMHEIVKMRRYTDTIPSANYVVLKEMEYAFDDDYLQLPPYLLYLTGVLDAKLKAAGFIWKGKDTTKSRITEDSVIAMAYNLLPDRSAEYYIAQAIYGRAKTQVLAKTLSQFARFKDRWPNSDYWPLLNKQVSLAERLAPGQPAPDMDIVTPDGKHMKLSDLRGKVVYLGFWASWCRQCVGEMINEKKIKDLLKKKPLEFVYVSIANDTASDRALAERYKIEGIFTNANGGWESKEVQLYGVQNIPAYYLIDEKGNFATQSAPTPMQTLELVLAIEKLFK